MAANSRSTSATWGQGAKVKSSNFETVEANAASAVRRDSTIGGSRHVPYIYCGAGATSVKELKCYLGEQYMQTTSGLNPQYVNFQLPPLPVGHSIVAVRMDVKPSSGHATEPVVMPQITLYRRDSTLGTVTALGTTAVAWTTAGAYNVTIKSMTITVATASRTIGSNHIYIVEYRNEGGSGATGNVNIIRTTANVTVDTASGGADFSFWA